MKNPDGRSHPGFFIFIIFPLRLPRSAVRTRYCAMQHNDTDIHNRGITILGAIEPRACPRRHIQECNVGRCRPIRTPQSYQLLPYCSISFVFQFVSCNRLSTSRTSFAIRSAVFCSSDAFSAARIRISVPRARSVLCPAA